MKPASKASAKPASTAKKPASRAGSKKPASKVRFVSFFTLFVPRVLQDRVCFVPLIYSCFAYYTRSLTFTPCAFSLSFIAFRRSALLRRKTTLPPPHRRPSLKNPKPRLLLLRQTMRANQQSQRLDPRTYLFFALWVGCASCIYPNITVSDFAHLCPISFAQTFPKLVYEFCIRIVTGPIAVVVSLLFYCPIVIVIAMAILSYDSDLLSLPLPPLILYPYSPRSAIPLLPL